jgi:hypothetical protein
VTIHSDRRQDRAVDSGSASTKEKDVAVHSEGERTVQTPDDLPLYPIRTAAQLTGVDARRLRSWESEYHLLQPARTRGGHRLYSASDLRLILEIKRLVDQEGMSLQGIKAWLESAAGPGVSDAPALPATRNAGRQGPGDPPLSVITALPRRG